MRGFQSIRAIRRLRTTIESALRLSPLGGRFTLVLMLVHLQSCVPVKDMIYLQPDMGKEGSELLSYENSNYRLQINDILDVKISSMDPGVNAMFSAAHSNTTQLAQVTAQTGGDMFYITGYSVSKAGTIELPFIGAINVLGLTLEEAHKKVENKVQKLFNNYFLQVRLGGVRFSVLGEFNRPGKRVVMQNQVTIFEAIAIGGDLTTVANRQRVKIIRQYPDGTRIHAIDLLQDSVVESPYYFIQPNDVIYVEPLPQKAWGVGVTGAQTLSTLVGTVSSSLALFLSILTLTQ